MLAADGALARGAGETVPISGAAMSASAELMAFGPPQGMCAMDQCRLCDAMHIGAIHSTVSEPIWRFSVHFEHKVR